jgi:hypothetical protein
MALAKILSLTLNTIDHQGRPLNPPQVTAEVSLMIEVPIPYEAMTNPAHIVQGYIRELGPQFASVDVESSDDLIVRP